MGQPRDVIVPIRTTTPGEWAALAVALFLAIHYAWLLDDAFVYFRYVDNWVLLERGIVYNPGEYAEGYTSPAWMLVLAALRAGGLGYWVAVQAIAAVSVLLFWRVAVSINRHLAGDARPIANAPLLFLAFHYGFLCYMTSGTESPLVLLSAALFVLYTIRPEWGPAHLLLPLLPLVRPELVLPLLAGLVWYRVQTRRVPWRMLAVTTVVNGGWVLFRILYYADLFPTTFHLKNVTDVAQGLRFVHDTFGPYHLYELLIAAAAAILLLRRAGRPIEALSARALVWVVAAALIVYTVKIGGDGRHFRYLAFPVTAGLLSLGGIAEACLARLTSESRRRQATALVIAGTALLSFALLPRQLARHPAFALEERPTRIDQITDAASHRMHPHVVSPAPFTRGDEIELRPAIERWRAAGGADPPTRIQAHRLCYSLYLAFDEWAVQSYGLTEPLLARVQVPHERPGHKPALIPLSKDIRDVIRWWERPPARGMYRAAVEADVAPAWIRDNLETIERIERKAYNEHSLGENLSLALYVRDRIELERRRP